MPIPAPATQETFVSGGSSSSGVPPSSAPSPAPPSEALQRALQKLREVFHIRELRPGQAEIMESVLAGQDTLAIMPTGSGKSLTYQLPSLVLPGPTLVVSPLLALIEDQVLKLKALGIPVARIDSTRTAKERAADLEAVCEGKIKLVLITPESIGSPTVQEALAGVKFSLFAVDEAHCVSQWGHDFRPSYLGLRRAAQVLGRPPILGLTATATPAIGDDVLVQLGMKDAKVCRVSFHRPNLAFDVRKVAGEADKLRQLGKLIQRLRRPGIVYCSTVRAVDDLYVALRHGKIPVERYNGKMTTDEREAAQASFMQPGRKVVMLATNAFGLGIDKPDIRYIIHYQMPGSPESYVQEAGRAGRDGKPARCVLLFQPDDIAIQEHFLKEAHPTKSQARMVADGLYAWSDEGKEVSVRDLALSMALPERRVRVILSVLEAMGVAQEVKAARWQGVEPRPSREQIDKAASVFEARRISDRRRLASLLAYMNTQRCRVQMMRAYFGEPEGAEVRPVRFVRGPGQRGVRSRIGRRAPRAARGDRLPRAPATAASRRGGEVRIEARKGEGAQQPPIGRPAQPYVPPAPVFETAIPGDILPPLAAAEVPAPPESELAFDEGIWNEMPEAGAWLAGDAVVDPDDGWFREDAPPSALPAVSNGVHDPMVGDGALAAADSALAAADGDAAAPADAATAPSPAPNFDNDWAAVRDANIRPYAEWRVAPPVALPVTSGGSAGSNRPQQSFQHHPNNNHHTRAITAARTAVARTVAVAVAAAAVADGGGARTEADRAAAAAAVARSRKGREGGERNRDRGPRLPGFYNPGGD